jgi:origin recognition complex subunit 5
MHIHTPFSPRSTASLVRAVLEDTHTLHAWVHGVECLSQRLFFDRVLQLLSGWQVTWEEGCESFGAGRYAGDLDGFVDGLRAIAREQTKMMVLVIEHAERFKDNLPELMVPLTRMAELVSGTIGEWCLR